MSDAFLEKNKIIQEQKEQEEKKIKQRQESADLLNQQMQQVSMSDAPNALESSMLMSQKADMSEVVKLHRDDTTTGIERAMAASEFKIESSKSKVRSDVLKKHAGLKGQERAEYIQEYKDFYKSLED